MLPPVNNDSGSPKDRLYIDIGILIIRVRCENPEVIHSLKNQFGRFAGSQMNPGKKIIDCHVMLNAILFREIQTTVSFHSPCIAVSPGVTIRYAFEKEKTWLSVSATAIIELDNSRPDKSTVYLEPVCHEKKKTGLLTKRADPEAFFYPLLAEWIRNFNACLIHCGAVTLKERAIVLTGPPGSGKSTHVLRMLLRGTQFLADDLAIIHRSRTGVRMLPLREVANVSGNVLGTFSELSFLKDCDRRGDGKYCLNIFEKMGLLAQSFAYPGVVIRMSPDTNEWFRPCVNADRFNHMHSMAWFVSRKKASVSHFNLLYDWLTASSHWEVSQGFLKSSMDRFIEKMNKVLDH